MCNCRKNVGSTAPPAGPRAAPAPRVVRGRAVPVPVAVAQPPAEPEPIDPALWGPQLWFVLHTLAELSVSSTVFGRWPRLLEILKSGLRCPECQGHFNAWVDAHPFPGAADRTQRVPAARRWVLDLHNNVSERRGVAVWDEAAVAAAYGTGDRALLRRTARGKLAEIRDRMGDRAWRILQGILTQM